MSDKITFGLDGLEQVLAVYQNAENEIVQRLESSLVKNVAAMAQEARNKVPVDTGMLKGATGWARLGPLSYDVYSHKTYAPYVEFGTGRLVDVPAGLEEYAMQFKGKGVRQVNLPARPYFFPAYVKYRQKIIDDLKKELDAIEKSGAGN